jgi:hypothetical protein
MTAQVAMPPPAAPSMFETPPVKSSLPLPSNGGASARAAPPASASPAAADAATPSLNNDIRSPSR